MILDAAQALGAIICLELVRLAVEEAREGRRWAGLYAAFLYTRAAEAAEAGDLRELDEVRRLHRRTGASAIERQVFDLSLDLEAVDRIAEGETKRLRKMRRMMARARLWHVTWEKNVWRA